MRNHSLLSTSLLGAALLVSAGCQNAGPQTQERAVQGGLIGALGGAMIGNNSGGGNGASGALVGAIAGALIGGAIGNETDQRDSTAYRTEQEATTTILMAEPPPPPSLPSEVIPRRPADEAVWVGGYWVFNSNHRYEWAPGRWEIPPSGCTAFVPPHWARQGNGYIYRHGYWKV